MDSVNVRVKGLLPTVYAKPEYYLKPYKRKGFWNLTFSRVPVVGEKLAIDGQHYVVWLVEWDVYPAGTLAGATIFVHPEASYDKRLEDYGRLDDWEYE